MKIERKKYRVYSDINCNYFFHVNGNDCTAYTRDRSRMTYVCEKVDRTRMAHLILKAKKVVQLSGKTRS